MGEGTLKVSFGGDSFLLTESLPVEVRDHNDALVGRAHGGFQRSLPEGLYVLRATLPDGSGHEEVVMVRREKVIERVLAPLPSARPGRAGAQIKAKARPVPREDLARPPAMEEGGGQALRETFGADDLWETSPGDEAPVPVEIIELRSCAVERAEGASFIFVPEAPVDDTPLAVLSYGGTRVSVSLPVNPTDGYPGNACVVAVTSGAGGTNRIVTRFAEQRRVASAIDGLLRSDRFLCDSDLLDQATEALRGKYRDPPAAALGALTLHRLGRLRERAIWVENLARDFRWLPDGRVLLAAVLCRDESRSERGRALDGLLEASGHRMMLTDGLALLLDLLRRWPDGEGEADRHGALALLARDVPGVDWDATFLTVCPEDAAK